MDKIIAVDFGNERDYYGSISAAVLGEMKKPKDSD